MPAEPHWLPVEEIIEINKDEVAQTNEPFLLREEGLLHSACAKPINRWHYADEHDVVWLAVALLHGIAKNHCFEQGNKRTAATAAIMFIRLNGYRWTAPNTIELGLIVEALINGEADEGHLADFMRSFIEPA